MNYRRIVMTQIFVSTVERLKHLISHQYRGLFGWEGDPMVAVTEGW